MVVAALGFLLGVVCFQQLPCLPDGLWYLFFLPLLPLTRHRRKLLLPLAFLAGFSWSHASALFNEPPIIPREWLGRNLQVVGQVLDLPEKQVRRQRFYFLAKVLQDDGRRLQGNWKLRLSWYGESPDLAAGETLRLCLRIKVARAYRNPGGFDYLAWLYARGVRYTGYVCEDDFQRLASPGISVDALRQRLADFIAGADLGAEAAAVLKALVVGDRSGLTREERLLFSHSGTSHLMAISGLHVGLVAGLLYLAFGWLWRRFPGLCSRWPARVAAVFPAMLGAVAYAALAGFSIPTRRALIMLLLVFLATAWRRRTSPANLLSLALLVVLLADPLAVVSVGFWLSFGAVAAIVWLSERPGRFLWLKLQFGIALALAPVLVWQQLPVSLLGPVVNLLAIPLFSLFIVPLALVGALLGQGWASLGRSVLQLDAWVLERFLSVLKWLMEAGPQMSLTLLPEPLLMVLSGIPLLALFPAIRPGWRWVAGLPGLVALVILLQRDAPPAAGNFRLTLLDVGQGLSAVVRTASHVLVFDTGPAFPSGFNTGDAVLLPWLRRQGVAAVDMLILSHNDLDHVGGARALLQAMPVADIRSGEAISLPGQSPGRCRAGQLWWWDGVRFEILYPPSGSGVQGNEASCVLRVSSNGDSLLLVGDIEKAGEQWLLANASGHLRSTLIVAAHHGSNSSSTKEFVAAVSPAQVLYAAGKDNRWGFPRPEVVARWASVGSGDANTAESGALQAVLGEPEEREFPARATWKRRYWHREPGFVSCDHCSEGAP